MLYRCAYQNNNHNERIVNYRQTHSCFRVWSRTWRNPQLTCIQWERWVLMSHFRFQELSRKNMSSEESEGGFPSRHGKQWILKNCINIHFAKSITIYNGKGNHSIVILSVREYEETHIDLAWKGAVRVKISRCPSYFLLFNWPTDRNLFVPW